MQTLHTFVTGKKHLDSCHKDFTTGVPCDCGAQQAFKELSDLEDELARCFLLLYEIRDNNNLLANKINDLVEGNYKREPHE